MTIVGIQCLLLGYSAKTTAPTWDEPAFLVAGLSHWELRRFDLYTVNPPLVRTIAAAPVHFFMSPEIDWGRYSANPAHRSEVLVGDDFIALNGLRSLNMFFVARLAVIPFALLGTMLCFLFANSLFKNRVAGVAAAVLWAFSPNTLGYGALITTDIPAAVMGLLAVYLLWRLIDKPSYSNSIALGVATGLAMLTKSVWLILPLIYLCVWLIHRYLLGNLAAQGDSKGNFGQILTRISVVGVLSLLMVNAMYGFQGSFKQLGNYTFVSRALADKSGQSLPPPRPLSLPVVEFRDIASPVVTPISVPACPHCEKSLLAAQDASISPTAVCPDCQATAIGVSNDQIASAPMFDVRPGNRYQESWMGKLPVPLPERFLEGIDIQRRDFESGLYRPEWASYFGGSWRQGGWWYFYLAGMFLKNSIALWFMLGLGVIAICRNSNKVSQTGLLCLLIPALFILVIVSANTGLNRYVRYALPILPSVVIVSAAATLGFASRTSKRFPAWIVRPSVALLLCTYVGSTIWNSPNWLGYFNLAAGGASNGHKWLLDSNLDWGQDLLAVNRWLDRNPEAKGHTALAYFGGFNPANIGIDFETPIPNNQDKAAAQFGAQHRASDPKWFIISKNYLMGHPMPVMAPDGTLRFTSGLPLTFFRHLEPVGKIGESMLIFHPSEQELARYRLAFGISPPVDSPSLSGNSNGESRRDSDHVVVHATINNVLLSK